jgi:hypothetical protein
MASTLWTDLINPVEATAIARDEQYLIEQSRGGSLARFLPNVTVGSDHVKFFPGVSSLVDAARYRAFNAPPEIGKGQGVVAKTIDLPAISRNEPIDEMTQKELARLSDDRIAKSIEAAIKRNTQAISMRQELTRGIAIDQGKVAVDLDNYWINDDFGRDASLSVSAGTGAWWADATVDRLTALSTWQDLYASFNNGANPGRLVFGSRAAYNAFAAGNQFKTLVGASGPARRWAPRSPATSRPPACRTSRSTNVASRSTARSRRCSTRRRSTSSRSPSRSTPKTVPCSARPIGASPSRPGSSRGALSPTSSPASSAACSRTSRSARPSRCRATPSASPCSPARTPRWPSRCCSERRAGPHDGGPAPGDPASGRAAQGLRGAGLGRDPGPPRRRRGYHPDPEAYAAAQGIEPSSAEGRHAEPAERPEGTPPPKAGQGSGRDNWLAYADEMDVEVPKGTGRDAIIQLLVDAGKPVDAAPVS